MIYRICGEEFESEKAVLTGLEVREAWDRAHPEKPSSERHVYRRTCHPELRNVIATRLIADDTETDTSHTDFVEFHLE